jgi:hypothetical protein
MGDILDILSLIVGVLSLILEVLKGLWALALEVAGWRQRHTSRL